MITVQDTTSAGAEGCRPTRRSSATRCRRWATADGDGQLRRGRRGAYDGEARTDGACPDSYTLTRTWTATDNCGNNSDARARRSRCRTRPTPVLTRARRTRRSSATRCRRPATATATDNCDDEPTVSYLGEERTDGTCPDSYTLTRTWTATDNCGNSSDESQVITVVDTTAPRVEIFSPVDRVVYYSTQPPVPVDYNVLDACDATPAVDVTRDEESFAGTEIDLTTLAYGTHVLCVTAADDCGNVAGRCVEFAVEPLPKGCFEVQNLTLRLDGRPCDGGEGDDDDDQGDDDDDDCFGQGNEGVGNG